MMSPEEFFWQALKLVLLEKQDNVSDYSIMDFFTLTREAARIRAIPIFLKEIGERAEVDFEGNTIIFSVEWKRRHVTVMNIAMTSSSCNYEVCAVLMSDYDGRIQGMKTYWLRCHDDYYDHGELLKLSNFENEGEVIHLFQDPK